MTDLIRLAQRNSARFAVAKITRGPEFASVAKRLVAAKPRYQAIEAKTGVPWAFIAVVHEREASQNFALSIAQGDPWDRVSRHVPKGRGPFASFEDAAVDALVNCQPYAARNKDWSIGSLLTMLEQYNGLGYASKDVPSPYIWAGTDQYVSGKYVADHVYDASVIDRQLGCAGLLLAMNAIDASIMFEASPQAPSMAQPTLRRGNTGDAVRELQRALKILDDGSFGPRTEEAVKAFQKSHGLLQDAIAGPQTLAALGVKP